MFQVLQTVETYRQRPSTVTAGLRPSTADCDGVLQFSRPARSADRLRLGAAPGAEVLRDVGERQDFVLVLRPRARRLARQMFVG